ncbi:MAG: YigZ family protein [Candidatus Cloacimonadota bacterium]|nr:YigZ family protein [Candidatus Cloacimonadota bacterium]
MGKYYYRIANKVESEIKIKRSKFITHLKYVEDINSAKDFISKITSQYMSANHNCWAYIVGKSAETYHSSDNGEPNGTAGKPMLHTLQKHNLTNIVAVVTRYFGGVKLGIRGLIDAYSLAIQTAVESTKLHKIVDKKNYEISTDYSFNESLKYQIEKLEGSIESVDYSDVVKINISIEKKKCSDLDNYLVEMQNAGKLNIV